MLSAVHEVLVLVMSTLTQSFPVSGRAPRAVPTAAFEVLGYLSVVGIATLCFLLGWLSPQGAVVLTVALLASLIVLAWNRFDQGRHPCFLFLCTLLLFQGGRLVGFCLGVIPDPFKIDIETTLPFPIRREEAGIVLLAIAMSAICIYAPCRWNYRRIEPPSDQTMRRYLPYLYVVFIFTISAQLVKNYLYLRYALDNGFYLVFFSDYNRLAASVPLAVRLIAPLNLPVFLAIFVIERKKKLLWMIVALYFGVAALFLATGQRMDTFSMALVLWYVARIKSSKRARILVPVLLAASMVPVAIIIGATRMGPALEQAYTVGPLELIAQQGISLNVTEVAIKYKDLFQPYIASYLFHDLRARFVSMDVSQYVRGWELGCDISVFLNPTRFRMGISSGTAYLAEMYLMGGLGGVVVLSLLIGYGLNFIYACGRNAWALIVVATILPDVILMPRGGLVVWASALIRDAILISPLLAGWWLFSLLSSIRGSSPNTLPPGPYDPANA